MEGRRRDTVLVFDYDGTLHNSALIYVPAFRRMYAAMVRDGAAPPRQWAPEEITRYLGCSLVEMWRDFMPEISRPLMDRYSGGLGQDMLAMIERGDAKWYDGAEATLQALRGRGYRMVVLSNCRKQYLDTNRKAFRMDRFFEGYYDCESYGFAPKPEIFRQIRRDRGAMEYVVIGDRRHDMEVARAHQLRSIGCLYGYGKPEELDLADEKIGRITQLLGILV